MDSPLPVYGSGGEFEFNPVDLVPELKGEYEKSSALGEWRRLTAIRLAEKDKLEKEMRAEILVEADEYKLIFTRGDRSLWRKRRFQTGRNRRHSSRTKRNSTKRLTQTNGKLLPILCPVKCRLKRREERRTKTRKAWKTN
ncbi:unnamed protein product [Rhodiola kirilowii]